MYPRQASLAVRSSWQDISCCKISEVEYRSNRPGVGFKGKSEDLVVVGALVVEGCSVWSAFERTLRAKPSRGSFNAQEVIQIRKTLDIYGLPIGSPRVSNTFRERLTRICVTGPLSHQLVDRFMLEISTSKPFTHPTLQLPANTLGVVFLRSSPVWAGSQVQ